MWLTRNWVAVVLALIIVGLVIAFIVVYYQEHDEDPRPNDKPSPDKLLSADDLDKLTSYKNRRVHVYHCNLKQAHTARNSNQSVIIYLDYDLRMYKPPVGIAGYSVGADKVTLNQILDDAITVVRSPEELERVLPILKEASEYFSGIRVIFDYPEWRQSGPELLKCNLIMIG